LNYQQYQSSLNFETQLDKNLYYHITNIPNQSCSATSAIGRSSRWLATNHM